MQVGLGVSVFMMAASLLEDNLRSLNDCLTESENTTKEQADSIVTDISQICINESTDKDIGNDKDSYMKSLDNLHK